MPAGEWAAAGAGDGRDVLAVLAGRVGQPDPLDTYTVATPGGGEHRYYSVPTDGRSTGRCTAGALGWLVDTRGVGGYVVAAGSAPSDVDNR